MIRPLLSLLSVCGLFAFTLFAGCTTLQTRSDAKLELVFHNPNEKIYTEYFITENGKRTRLDLSPLYNPKIVVDVATMEEYGDYKILYSPTRRSIALVEDSGASELRNVLIQKRGDSWEAYQLTFPGSPMPWERQVVSLTDQAAVVRVADGSMKKFPLSSLKPHK